MKKRAPNDAQKVLIGQMLFQMPRCDSQLPQVSEPGFVTVVENIWG